MTFQNKYIFFVHEFDLCHNNLLHRNSRINNCGDRLFHTQLTVHDK